MKLEHLLLYWEDNRVWMLIIKHCNYSLKIQNRELYTYYDNNFTQTYSYVCCQWRVGSNINFFKRKYFPAIKYAALVGKQQEVFVNQHPLCNSCVMRCCKFQRHWLVSRTSHHTYGDNRMSLILNTLLLKKGYKMKDWLKHFQNALRQESEAIALSREDF